MLPYRGRWTCCNPHPCQGHGTEIPAISQGSDAHRKRDTRGFDKTGFFESEILKLNYPPRFDPSAFFSVARRNTNNSTQNKMTIYIITASNIDKETYFNLVRLVNITGYAYPDKAIKSLNCEWSVIKDDCGNIISASK